MWYIREVRKDDLTHIAKIRADARNALPESVCPQPMKLYQNYDKKLDSAKKVYDLANKKKRWFYVYEKESKRMWMTILHIHEQELWAIYVSPEYQWVWIWTALWEHWVYVFKQHWFERIDLLWIKWNVQSKKFYLWKWCKITWDEKVYSRNWATIYTIKYTYDLTKNY